MPLNHLSKHLSLYFKVNWKLVVKYWAYVIEHPKGCSILLTLPLEHNQSYPIFYIVFLPILFKSELLGKRQLSLKLYALLLQVYVSYTAPPPPASMCAFCLLFCPWSKGKKGWNEAREQQNQICHSWTAQNRLIGPRAKIRNTSI